MKMDFLQHQLQHLRSSFGQLGRTTTVSIAASLGLVATWAVIQDYIAWRALGPGGLPYSFFGYTLNILLPLRLQVTKDTKTLSPYADPSKFVAGWSEIPEEDKAKAYASFLTSPLEKRDGPASNAKRFAIPQRQLNLDEKTQETEQHRMDYLAKYQALLAKNSSQVESRTSQLEKRGEACFLREHVPVPPTAASSKREMCHIHSSDLSAHVVLSLKDAESVIAQGWGERHRFSGGMLPLGYTMLYVPRSSHEVETNVRLMQAAIDFMCSSAGGK